MNRRYKKPRQTKQQKFT